MTSRIARLLAVAATGLAVVAGTAGPAAADDSAAPACVTYTQGYYYLQADNDCDYDVHIYARYANGSQSTPAHLSAHTGPTTIGSGYGYSAVQSVRLAPKVTVRVHYNVGWDNRITIRGDAAPLSWSAGQDCANKAADLWECTVTGIPGGTAFEYKILINDSSWSTGANRVAISGRGHDIWPAF